MIRLATAADLPQVAEIYEAVLDHEAETGVVYTNWQKGAYPTADTARSIFEEGTLYVAEDEDGVIYGTMNLNGKQLPEYVNVPWSIAADDAQVAVIHTLAIHPDYFGRHLAREMIAWAEAEARRQGKTAMRFDTWENNVPANHLYPLLGYRFAGATEFFFMGYTREILNLYEKAL